MDADQISYHRMRIRVKLTCDEMSGSVGARDLRQHLQAFDGQRSIELCEDIAADARVRQAAGLLK
jgi:hypothetical protein